MSRLRLARSHLNRQLYIIICVFLQLCTDALKNGWTKFKVKVGADLEDDIRRCRLIRQMIGPSNTLVKVVFAPSVVFTLGNNCIRKCIFVSDDRCQPEMGCSRGHPLGVQPGWVQTSLDRGAHVSRRHPGSRCYLQGEREVWLPTLFMCRCVEDVDQLWDNGPQSTDIPFNTGERFHIPVWLFCVSLVILHLIFSCFSHLFWRFASLCSPFLTLCGHFTSLVILCIFVDVLVVHLVSL